MAQIILGIDIGSYSIKVAEVRRSFSLFQFTNFYEQRIQYSEVLSPEESLSSALQAVLEDNALSWDVAYAALPSPSIATRVLVLPFGNAKKIEQTLGFEIEEHLPFPMEDVIFDYHTVESTKEMSRLLIFYTRKVEIAQRLAFLNDAGVEPQKLCHGGVEFLNLINVGLSPPDAPYAIIDMGHQQTTITICAGKRLIYARTISLGGRDITQAIAKAVGASEDEAERLKVEIGQVPTGEELPAADTIPNKVSRAIGEVLQEIVLNIRQTLFAHREQATEMIEGIYLCGGTAKLSSIDDYLSMALQQNVSFLDCHNFHFTQVDRAEVSGETAAGALALALRSVAASGMPQIDFRQDEFQYRADTEQFERTIRHGLIAAGLIVVLGLTYFGLRWYSLAGQLEQREAEVIRLIKQNVPKGDRKKIKTASSALKTLDGAKKETERRITVLKDLTSTSILNVLKRFSEGVPNRETIELNVDKFHYKHGVIRVASESPSSSAVDQVRTAISTALTKHKDAETGKMMPPKDGGEPMVVDFPSAKTGAKGELKFDIIMQSQSTLAKAEAKKKTRGRGRRKKRR
jgi:type IV pilus assembly protein PilM